MISKKKLYVLGSVSAVITMMLAGCATTNRQMLNTFSAIRITIGEDTLQRHPSKIPDLILTVFNQGDTPLKYAKYDRPFWGEAILICNSKQYVLYDRTVISATAFGALDVSGEYLPAKGSYTKRISLVRDYLTEEEFKSEALAHGDSVRTRVSWSDTVKTNESYLIFLKDSRCGLVSNEILVNMLD